MFTNTLLKLKVAQNSLKLTLTHMEKIYPTYIYKDINKILEDSSVMIYE